jgi:hypothetical protein
VPDPLILTHNQLDEFGRRGVLRLPGLLSADRVRRAREHVQHRLALRGLWKDGTWCLGTARPQWPATGLKTSKVIGNKHPDVEALLDEPALVSAVENLLGGCALDRTMISRPQVLVTLPNSDAWTAPTGWHVDVPRLANAYLTDLRVLHTAAPNATDRPRMMATHRFVRADVVQELNEAYGWK